MYHHGARHQAVLGVDLLLRVFGEGKANFADCLIERSAAGAGCAQTMTLIVLNENRLIRSVIVAACMNIIRTMTLIFTDFHRPMAAIPLFPVTVKSVPIVDGHDLEDVTFVVLTTQARIVIHFSGSKFSTDSRRHSSAHSFFLSFVVRTTGEPCHPPPFMGDLSLSGYGLLPQMGKSLQSLFVTVRAGGSV